MNNILTKSISIVIPALNERDGIAKTVRAVPRSKLEQMGYRVQVLVVNNGSTDGTDELAGKAGADVVHESRKGYGYAYKTGFCHAQGDIIATADADLTYPVEDIPKFLQIMEEEGLDFITTNRFTPGSDGAIRPLHKVGNAVLTLTFQLLYGLDIHDSQSGMWVFKKDLLDKMHLESNGMPLSQELKIEACYFLRSRWKELPITYRSRLGTVKLRSWEDGFANLGFLVKKKFASRKR